MGFSGLRRPQFDRVLDIYQAGRKKSGRKLGSVNDQDRVLFTLAWMNNYSFKRISLFSGTMEDTVAKIVNSSLVILSTAYQKYIYLPPLNELVASNSVEFRNTFGHQFCSMLIPDGTSLMLNNPLRNGKEYFTSYKGHNSLRYFILVDTRGRIVYVSKLFLANKLIKKCGLSLVW